MPSPFRLARFAPVLLVCVALLYALRPSEFAVEPPVVASETTTRRPSARPSSGAELEASNAPVSFTAPVLSGSSSRDRSSVLPRDASTGGNRLETLLLPPTLIPAITAGFPEQRVPSGEFLVVIGIPSMDTPKSAERRAAQRNSWWRYPNVHDDTRNPTGSVVVRYVVGRHPLHGHNFSSALLAEAAAHRDIVALDLHEGASGPAKTSTYWTFEAEVGMSRKAYAWYCLAAARYPGARHVMKADDDVFLRTVLYESVLTSLAPKADGISGPSLYWGRAMRWGAVKGDANSRFFFVGGMALTMSRDLARWIANATDLRRNMGPFHGDKAAYKRGNMDHEDVMVGRWLYDRRRRHTIVRDCRFHDVHVGANVAPLTATSIGIHHLRVDEYAALMHRFPDTERVPSLAPLPSASEDGRGNKVIKIC